MSRYRNHLVLGVLLLLTTTGLVYTVTQHVPWLEDVALASSLVVALVEIGGLLAIGYQLKEQKDVEVANFLLEFEKSFVEHRPTFARIEASREENLLTEDDVDGLVRYLTFFESLDHFIRRHVLDLEMVDELFGYRFFVAMHCEYIQEHHLEPFHEYYGNLFHLYERWYDHRVRAGRRIPRDFNRLDLHALRHDAWARPLRIGHLRRPGHLGAEPASIPYEMRFLQDEELDDLVALQDRVAARIEDEALFQRTTREEFSVRLREQGRILGVFAEGELVAFLALYFPAADDPHHLGHDAGLESGELDAVAYLESLAVRPDLRGQGLQRRMQEEAYELAVELGYRHLMATVSPANGPSLRNLLAFRLRVVARVDKYEGKLRFVVHRDLRHPVRLERHRDTAVPHTDEAAQRRLLDTGWQGVALQRGVDGGPHRVVFAPPLAA